MKNRNSIAIFENKNRDEEKNHPHLNAVITIDGKEYTTGLWKKVSEKGVKYYSGTPRVKDVQQKAEFAKPEQPNDDTREELDDDIPF